MPLILSFITILVLVGITFWAVAREPGPTAEDCAIAFEEAWDRSDFRAVFDLSGPELRDGMKRPAFVAAKRAVHDVHGVGRLVERVQVTGSVVHGDTAVVCTRLQTADGTVDTEVHLERRSGRWFVVRHGLRVD